MALFVTVVVCVAPVAIGIAKALGLFKPYSNNRYYYKKFQNLEFTREQLSKYEKP